MADFVNVDELQQEIERRAATAGPEPRFPQLEIQRVLPELREHHMVEPRPLLIGRTRYERLWVRINTFVRRVAAHAVEPAITQQNEFNAVLLASLEDLVRAQAALRAAVVQHRATRAASDQTHDA